MSRDTPHPIPTFLFLEKADITCIVESKVKSVKVKETMTPVGQAEQCIASLLRRGN